MNFKIKPLAENDLAESVDWYALQRQNLEIDFLNEIDKTIKRIQLNPEAYTIKYKRKGIIIRVALVDKFPYFIVYFVDISLELIIILAVWHTARNPKKLKDRI